MIEAGSLLNAAEGVQRIPFLLWTLWIANIAFFLVYLVKFGWTSVL